MNNKEGNLTQMNLPAGTKTIRDIPYLTDGARKLLLDLYLPGAPDNSTPLIIWIHGGGWRCGSRNSHSDWWSPALRRGFSIAAIEYRLSGEAAFPAAIEDCKAAVGFLRLHGSRFNLDKRRFGVWGASAGGHLALMLGTTNVVDDFNIHHLCSRSSTEVQAVCSWFGITDLLQEVPDAGLMEFLGGPVHEHKEKARQASPITWVNSSNPPIFLLHGDRDPWVHCSQSESFYEASRAVGATSRFYKVKNGDHSFEGAIESVGNLADMSIDFFEQYL